MEQYGKKGFMERAMFYGTLFGVIMIFTNIFYLLGLKIQFFSTLFLILMVSSPVIAGRMALIFRRRECDNRLPFAGAWSFLMIMYVCSAILTAIAQFVYFRFADNGFFMETILQQFGELLSVEELSSALKEQLQTTSEMLKMLTCRDIILQIFSTNILLSPIITVIIAIFVQKK